MFLGFIVVFHQKNAFLSWKKKKIFFFDELKNLHNRTLGNQKLELLRINCQWNCMYKKDAQGCIKSTGTPDGRNIIIQTSELVQDRLWISLSDCD